MDTNSFFIRRARSADWVAYFSRPRAARTARIAATTATAATNKALPPISSGRCSIALQPPAGQRYCCPYELSTRIRTRLRPSEDAAEHHTSYISTTGLEAPPSGVRITVERGEAEPGLLLQQCLVFIIGVDDRPPRE